MRLLLVIRHPLIMRNFEALAEAILEAGHELVVVLATGERSEQRNFLDPLLERYPKASCLEPNLPGSAWQAELERARALRNYLRYLHPRLRHCKATRSRAARLLPKAWTQAVDELPDWLGNQLRALADPLLACLEDLHPVSDAMRDFLRAQRPDLVLASPVVGLEAAEIDYLKGARELGIPCCLCVASWDNLTNKGIIQGRPTFVQVWNELQREEAVALHHQRPARVFACGAHLFDQWFERKPAISREDFLAARGLPTDRPLILYLGSSKFISGDESRFVRDWVQAIRQSGESELAQASILVRPHPFSGIRYWKDWQGQFEGVEAFTVWPTADGLSGSQDSRQDYLESLAFADLAVGINTSAFIEAGILGTAGFTLEDPRFTQSQEETIHFHYLTEGGLVQSAASVEEHVDQLAQALREPEASRERTRAFTASFVRPGGLEASATALACRQLTVDIPDQLQGQSIGLSPLMKAARKLYGAIRNAF